MPGLLIRCAASVVLPTTGFAAAAKALARCPCDRAQPDTAYDAPR